MLDRLSSPNEFLDRDTELRNLPLGVQHDIRVLLDRNNDWREIMARIRKESSSSAARLYKYTALDIRTIEEAAYQQHRSCTDIFLSEWGTSGQRRPTLNDLLDLLTDAQLFRAADYVAHLLGVSFPPRPAETPAARVDVSDEAIAALLENARREEEKKTNVTNIVVESAAEVVPNNTPPLAPIVSPETGVLTYPYNLLEMWTNGFNGDEVLDTPKGRVKRQLGAGGFGSVYLAKLSDGEYVAVKRLHVRAEVPVLPAQFNYEVKTLSEIRHPNLLSLVGYSNDGPECCLLYEYLDGGNLQARLADKGDPLPWLKRIEIAQCVAKGLDHLHTAPGGPYIHRDVKSANILLTAIGDVKIGDFGLIRWAPYLDATRGVMTSNIVGSTPYMAPEAFRGDISIKLDTFSFGVVLTELMTALPAFDVNREDTDLVTHFESQCDSSFGSLLDTNAGDWPSNVVDKVFNLTKDCFRDKQFRPVMTIVARRITEIVQESSN